jgi:hypothetical protein
MLCNTETDVGPRLSILHCIDGKGQIIIDKYIMYRRQQDEDMLEVLSTYKLKRVNIPNPPLPRTRSCKRKDLSKVCDDGTVFNVLWKDSIWYMTYVNTPAINDLSFHKKFKNRF